MIKRCWRDHASQGQHDSTNATAWFTYGASFKCLLNKLQFLALTLCLFFSLFVFSGSLKRPGLVSVLFISDTRTGLASTHWPSPGARGGVSKGPHEKLWAEFSSASYYFWCEPPQQFDLLPRMKMIWEPQCRQEYDGVCITGSGSSASQLGNCSLVSR